MSWGVDFDNSSESLTDQRQTGSQSQQGGASSVSLGATNKSNVNIVTNQTDHGAVAASIGAVQDMSIYALKVGDSAIQAGNTITLNAMNKLEDGYFAAGALVRETTQEAFDFGRRALASVDDAVSLNASIAQSAMFQADQTISAAVRMNENNNFLVQDLNSKNAGLAESLADKVASNSREVLYTISGLNEQRGLETNQVIKTVKELAEVVQTGGASISTNANKLITMLAVAGLAFVAWRALA